MKLLARLTPILLLAACGGAPTLYTSAGEGRISDVIACAADAIDDEGFSVTDRNNDAGLLNAEYTGQDDEADGSWLEIRVLRDEALEYQIEVKTSDTDRAKDAASEVASECGWIG